ncbi:MAG: acyl-[acyl-carrier-protein] thioesterase [Lachnospiraceae bacterium]|nr:acyl-[acyl-carrier-protein] thioesterase [Lachnospiraceae bacterium]
MYSFDSRIRYSEVGSDGRLTLLSLLNYFQDCATFHSEDLGVGVEYLEKLHSVWVMNFWQIDIDRFPALGEKVKIETHPYDFKRCLGSRNFGMRDESGVRVSVANTLWTFLDTNTGRPTKPTEEMLEKYGMEPPYDMEYLDRKITFEGGGKKEEPVEIRKHHLDTNHHVNNAQYVSIACDFLPEAFEVCRMRATYHKSAMLSDLLYPVVYGEKEHCIGVALCDENGSAYANVEFCNTK